MLYQRSRAVVVGVIVQATLTACSAGAGGDELVSSDTHEIAGCTGTGLSIYQQLCGVGESGGRPAVNFRGQWFRLDYDGTTWAITNGVPAAESAVAPIDTTSEDTRPACRAACPPLCRTRACWEERNQCLEPCETMYSLREHRKLVWSVAGHTYELEGTQRIENQRTQNGGLDVRIGANLTLAMRTSDPADGNLWTVTAHPVRVKTDAPDQVEANWNATEPTATTTLGDYNGLFSETQINVRITPQVEVMSAVKTGVPGASAMVARSNLAMNRALDANLQQGAWYQAHFEPEALSTSGTVLGRAPDLGGIGAYDMQRASQFFMNDRRGHAGFSSSGSGERPFAQSTRREWKFHHNIRDYSVYFPFLAGICGFEVWVRSYIAGAFSIGRRACFDGVPLDVDMAGFLEFALGAGGGLGCNIVVASASAGLGAGIRARTEFATSIDALSVPPALTASVNIYSDVDYFARFKVRVLFWTKKWEKAAQRRLFQKGANYRLASSHKLPRDQLCSLGGTPADVGTCADPEATCDVDGRCVRYDLASTGQVERADVDQCTLPACTTNPPLPDDTLRNPFTASFAACAPQCGEIPLGIVNPDGSPCTGTCDGLPDNFDRSLLTIPRNAELEILTSSDGGQRARLFKWTADGRKKAVVEITGVTTGAGDLQDVENSARDFVDKRLSPTAVAVNARLRRLKDPAGEAYRHNDILIRGHSLGSLDAYQVMDMNFPTNGAGAGHGILLGVPLHAIVRINKTFWDARAHPLINSEVGIFVSTTDPVARGFDVLERGQWRDVWCKAKKGPGPGFNQALPPHLKFNVMETPTNSYIAGHFIDSYCRVAKATCFAGPSFNRDTTVTLQASTGHLVSAEGAGGGPIKANRTAPGSWEHFVIESFGPLSHGSSVYVRTQDNKHFFTFVRNFPSSPVLSAEGTKRTATTTFTVERVAGPGEVRSGDAIALRALSNGKYVSARDGGGGDLEINRTQLLGWETFRVNVVASAPMSTQSN